MADFTDLVLFLSTERALAWIGAGPSAELGLPTWKRLANHVLEQCRRQQRNNFSRIERHYREGSYLDQFDEVELAYGREFLHSICMPEVADPGGEGSIYGALSNLDFLGYLTTNYDDILYRHLQIGGKAVKVYRNSQDDLEDIDLDRIPSLVKLHGDFSDSESVVLTRSDYQRLYFSGRGATFRAFLTAILGRDRILFLGYSLNDPEILHIQENLAVNLKRKVAPIAILPDVSLDDVELWKRRYNIDVVPYTTRGSGHDALTSMLKSASDVISIGNFAEARTPANDLRQAQALYMWYRFSPTAADRAPIDALQSLVLSSLVGLHGSSSQQAVANTLSNDLGTNIDSDSVELDSAIKRLIEDGWLALTNGTLSVLPEGRRLVERYERQFDDLITVFTRQLSLDLKNTFNIVDSDADAFARVVLEALIDLFELRGRNIMELVFDSTPIDPHGITDMLQTLWRRANTLEDPNARPPLVAFVLNILTNPSGIYEEVLNYLAKSFFSIQAIRLDPEVPRLISEVIADRTLLIDENILIPLTARYEDRHEFLHEVFRNAKEGGLGLCTTQRFVDSVRRHADWALDLVKEYGIQSEEVMYAARGDGGYAPNAFLRGYINQDPDDRSRDFLQYLRDCFGGTYLRESFDAFFEDTLGIHILNVRRMADFTQSKADQHAEAVRLLNDWNETRAEDSKKSIRRIESEVEALLLIANWEDATERVSGLTNSRVSFVTSGSSVPRLARRMELGAGPMIVASAEAIWELMSRPEPTEDRSPSFRSMMLASHFKMAGHFVQIENYKRFFRPLIANARQELEQSRDLFEDALGMELSPRFFDDFNQEDLPRILSSLQMEAVHKTSERNLEQQRLIDENERLRKIVYDLQERERKRREFVARQRREQQSRRGRQ